MLKIPFFKSKVALEEYFLALDLGGSQVKAAVFKLEEEKEEAIGFLKESGGRTLSVVGFGRAPQTAGAMYSGAVADIGAVVKSAKEAIGEASFSCGHTPNGALLGLWGEAVSGLTTTARLTRQDGRKPLEEKELEFLAGRVKEAALAEAEKEREVAFGSLPSGEIVFSELEEIKIDGFRVSDPRGLGGQVLEISIFTALCPAAQVASLREVLKRLGLRPRVLLPSLFPLGRLLGRGGRGDINFLLLDIGGMTTDIALYFGGKYASARTVNLGGEAFTRTLAASLNISFEKAEEKKIAYSQGKVAGGEVERIKELLKPTASLWCSTIEAALSDFSSVKVFPETVIFTGGGSLLPDLIETFHRFPWQRTLSFSAAPKVRTLAADVVEDVLVNKTGREFLPADILPLGLGFFISVLEEKHNVQAFFRA